MLLLLLLLLSIAVLNEYVLRYKEREKKRYMRNNEEKSPYSENEKKQEREKRAGDRKERWCRHSHLCGDDVAFNSLHTEPLLVLFERKFDPFCNWLERMTFFCRPRSLYLSRSLSCSFFFSFYSFVHYSVQFDSMPFIIHLFCLRCVLLFVRLTFPDLKYRSIHLWTKGMCESSGKCMWNINDSIVWLAATAARGTIWILFAIFSFEL